MWKKDKQEVKSPVFSTGIPSKEEIKKPSEEKMAYIGKTIVVKGELSGKEDLYIEGTVEGKIFLKDNTLIVGPEGKVMAEIHAKRITINGSVNGNINATEIVIINKTGSLQGDIYSPRISIADGAHFKGSVKMEKVASTPPPQKEKFLTEKEEEKEKEKEKEKKIDTKKI
ncbi:polymer-forming cytoskeletal protein [Candidatus Aminicenantes bacterium AC-335-A11]|jgi:cytoskeletal protein CcmA (bactofilin family)|nr:polymer-forming cytoskeletal protein [SCandidatus Aminicenantes bacterium Aminicenantia_JdfR_composite]MCP2598822.1 polymer-forming cytoskeletal protein [Candidatus Aminicenantes bacterium AC-335-L06]MCP2619141.1 polymer-forming cytoskeletal protein [Candidatus Aminicenantes bacterium AC-335-A11]MCP2621225.1 polymer-forming cytoskeletal protein [Candidatus Aminicenantes bacterium AC-334-E05]